MRTLEQHLDPGLGPKRMLALDGGGVKGILTLGMLEVLEAELARRAGHEHFVLSDYFDLIGGTSTGAIIATALALGMPVRQITDMYLQMGPKVFGKASGDGYLIDKYDQRALRRALYPVLDKKTLGSRQLKTGLALHCKRIDTGAAWVLTNNPNAKYFDPPKGTSDSAPNKDYRLVDLVLASAAAPTFFKGVEIHIAYDAKDQPIKTGYFVDGALGGFNNPSIQMLLTALVPAYGFAWQPGPDKLMLASIGTGLRRPQFDGREFARNPSFQRGADALRSMIFDTQLQGVQLLQALSEPKKPQEINSEIGDMGGHCITGLPLLNFQRLDILLDSKPKGKAKGQSQRTGIEELLQREIKAEALEKLDQMAHGAPDNMELLLEIGRKAAPRFVQPDWPDPAFDLPEWRKGPAA